MERSQVVCRNRKAAHDYFFEDQWEAGIALLGSEVKSLRQGRATLTDAFGEIRNGELWLVGADISIYPFAHARNHEPRRDRKLLLHKQEITRIATKVATKGYTLVPTEMFLKGGRIKVNLALARGKKQHDKREQERRRTEQREIAAELGRRRKSKGD